MALMPKHVQQPDDLGDFLRLNDNAQSAAKLRMGTNKWYRKRDEIEHIEIDARRYWTDEALLKFAKKNTVKPDTARPLSRRGRKPRTDAVTKAAPHAATRPSAAALSATTSARCGHDRPEA
jgi:hypothetical protein